MKVEEFTEKDDIKLYQKSFISKKGNKVTLLCISVNGKEIVLGYL